jgi:hypothetical protein
MNLRKIYEGLRQQAEIYVQNIDEGRLRQQAWMMRDIMMFEQSFTNNFNSSSAAAGGSINSEEDNTINSFIEDDYIEDYFE